jgi:hypothetical protein
MRLIGLAVVFALSLALSPEIWLHEPKIPTIFGAKDFAQAGGRSSG